jgi:hypothetical protein
MALLFSTKVLGLTPHSTFNLRPCRDCGALVAHVRKTGTVHEAHLPSGRHQAALRTHAFGRLLFKARAAAWFRGVKS